MSQKTQVPIPPKPLLYAGNCMLTQRHITSLPRLTPEVLEPSDPRNNEHNAEDHDCCDDGYHVQIRTFVLGLVDRVIRMKEIKSATVSCTETFSSIDVGTIPNFRKLYLSFSEGT